MGAILIGVGQEVVGEVSEEWPDEFTREEMLEQQSRLLIEECHMLQKELNRYRKNMAKLIDINSEVTTERDKLRAGLKAATKQISDLNVAACESWKRYNSLQHVLNQRGAVMRQYGVPEHYFGTPASES